MDIIADIIKSQSLIAEIYHKYGDDKEVYEMLWTAVSNNDKDQSITLLNCIILDLDKRVYDERATNGIDKILKLVEFNSKLQEDLARGKRKTSSLADIMDNKEDDPIEKIKAEIKPKDKPKSIKPTNILDI